MINYSKKFQKKIEYGIGDYKEFSQLYSSIIIGIELADGYSTKYINFDEEDRQYFHIYFFKNKITRNEYIKNRNMAFKNIENEEEIKRKKPYLNKNENINKYIKIKIDYQIRSFKNLFAECKYIKYIHFLKFHRKNIINMRGMFKKCPSLETIDFSEFNTENVTDMSFMFSECTALKELNLSNFNTSNVTDMRYMFNECKLLKELNLSNFNTEKVVSIENMFYCCSSLISLDLSNFNTSNVVCIDHLFMDCASLDELKLNEIKMDKIFSIKGVIAGCKEKIKSKVWFLICSN